MKITSIDIPADEATGLQHIKMSKLGNLVLIAGKNGSGKSRILLKIKNTLSTKPSDSRIANASKQLNHWLTQIDIANHSGYNVQNIPQWEKQVEFYKNDANWNYITTNADMEKSECFDFVPKRLDMQDPHSLAKSQIENHAKSILNINIGGINNQTLSAIQDIQNKWFEATHPSSSLSSEQKDEISANYSRLCEYIELFLETKLDRNERGDATLFNFRIGEARLSDGQKILLQFCLAIYSQETKLSDLILMLDEPENHLHPAALVDVMDKIVNAVTNGQVWIATHSINLLAHFEPQNIWYVEDGRISYAGSVPNKVLTGLLGDDDEIERLSSFLSLPAQMATNQFSFECLFEPKTVSTGGDDPQTNQIIENIEKLVRDNESIKILDFGAGKGRLLSTIRELNLEHNIDTSSWLDYYAFDLESSDNDICKKIIDSVYTDDINRFFNSKKTLIEETEQNSFDIIIMCNVLHEVDAKDWLSFFDEHSIFTHALKENGTLLIVEDQFLAMGEKAYQNGFLVFDKIQFKKLFNITDNYLVHDARGDGRLKAHFIKKEYLQNITADTRIESIKSLLNTSKEEVLRLRSEEATYKNGKLHGFWVQQLANAQLALSELDK